MQFPFIDIHICRLSAFFNCTPFKGKRNACLKRRKNSGNYEKKSIMSLSCILTH